MTTDKKLPIKRMDADEADYFLGQTRAKHPGEPLTGERAQRYLRGLLDMFGYREVQIEAGEVGVAIWYRPSVEDDD